MTALGSISVLLALTALPAWATWTGDNCYVDNHSTTARTRIEARSYAIPAIDEGYEWGGGCWNDNDVDDTPNLDYNANGEGPDCSGLTFKTWHMKKDYGATGWWWWNRMENTHGPYGTLAFLNPPKDGPYYLLANKERSTTDVLDAFVHNDNGSGHIGMLYTNLPPNDNTDYILEAYNNESGVDVNVRDYRSDPRYKAIRRKGWAPPCYVPPCIAPEVRVP
jgi:hypothetical protein